MCWAKAPEGFQVEGRENRVSEGSCVGEWDHVADSGTPPCGQTGLGQRVLEGACVWRVSSRIEVWWVGKSEGKGGRAFRERTGTRRWWCLREGSTCRIFSRSAKILLSLLRSFLTLPRLSIYVSTSCARTLAVVDHGRVRWTRVGHVAVASSASGELHTLGGRDFPIPRGLPVKIP